MTGATGNWYCGLHEFSDMAFALHLLRPDDLFADIGANIGSYSVLASGVVGARSMSFEPVPDTYRKLQRNVSANRLEDRVAAHNIGLSGAEEILRFTAHRDTINHVVSGQTDEPTIEVPVRCFDSLADGAVPCVVKLDVEGWEAHVLDGMPQTLADSRLVAIITETNQSAGRHGGAAGEDRVAAIMEAHGFAPFTYDPFERQLAEGGSSHNTIFVRDLAVVRVRLKTAPKRRVF